MTLKLTKNQIDIIDHTLHRTANGLFCGNSDDMQTLVRLGLMYSQGKAGFCPDEYFGVTAKGRAVFDEIKTGDKP